MKVEYLFGPMDGTRTELQDQAHQVRIPKESAFNGRSLIYVYRKTERIKDGRVIFEMVRAE